MVCVTRVSHGTLLITFPSLGTVQNESWKFYSYQNAAATGDESVVQVVQSEMTSQMWSGLSGTPRPGPIRPSEMGSSLLSPEF